MKKFLVSSVFVLAFAAYIYTNNDDTTVAAPSVGAPNINAVSNTSDEGSVSAGGAPPSNNASKPTTVTSGVTKPTTTTTTTTKSTGQYKDGTYTGSVADAYYGNIQVAATISGGRLTDVTFLQYPNDRRESISINQQAMPMLKSEAIAAQSARVSGVSGASDTSAAFKQSLSSALSKAA